MNTAHWPQEIMKPMEEIVVQNTSNSCSKLPSSTLERKTRPQKDSAVNCPRCNSTNTKFCYYNNYSLSQPRYFCKTCRRYWTEGGSLRNVPVGGGSRKNKRSSHQSSMSKKLPDLVVPPASIPVLVSQNPSSRMMHHEHAQDLNLGYPSTNDFKTISELIQVPNFDHGIKNNSTSTCGSALELLTGVTTRGHVMTNSFMPNPNPIPDHPNSVYSSLNFSLDGMEGNVNGGGAGNRYGSSINECSSGRLLFPFEDLKTSTITSTTTTSQDHVEQNRDHNGSDANGFWSGMLGGGSW
ncbi:hypothetical protein QVD17_41180 [Tagetes erecta]|uniref:Dof zinc finger protein n=1 Tax=Tagetes erecta TaxID=13708 RepID=A0AAD8NHA8_TARER|nr:hypothetical protein QVD17_41180 [Tagetes erecta]